MKSYALIITSLIFISLTISCNSEPASETTSSASEQESKSEMKTNEGFALTRNGIKLTPVQDSPAYPKAKLSLSTPDLSSALNVGTHEFNFQVDNYNLGVQTKDASQKMCANSGKGQHIHFILNNAPYTAHYDPAFKKDLPAGHHVLLAFLSRSYHESLKTKDAFILKEFNVGSGAHTDNFDETAPHLFYSRPKGTYVGKDDIQKLLLDFFVVNADLSDTGYKVRATINGTEFMLTKWVPYFIEGLPEGTVTIKLDLLDPAGSSVKSPFNPVERKVTLAESEPLPAN